VSTDSKGKTHQINDKLARIRSRAPGQSVLRPVMPSTTRSIPKLYLTQFLLRLAVEKINTSTAGAGHNLASESPCPAFLFFDLRSLEIARTRTNLLNEDLTRAFGRKLFPSQAWP
jgi:hypothetical protein